MSDILESVKYNEQGLVPAIAQDLRTDEVLMLAYMNEESLKKTVETGFAHYYSRSRQKLWLKGETSGHFQKVRSISFDCDFDAILLKVEQTGAACHTGHRSCFFTRLETNELRDGMKEENAAGLSGEEGGGAVESGASCEADGAVESSASCKPAAEGEKAAGTAAAGMKEETGNGSEVLQKVFDVITDRMENPKEGSYTNYLFTKGLDKILKKVGEEACEVVVASKNGSKDEIKAEIADLMYHIMVLLAERGMTLDDVYRELEQRF